MSDQAAATPAAGGVLPLLAAAFVRLRGGAGTSYTSLQRGQGREMEASPRSRTVSADDEEDSDSSVESLQAYQTMQLDEDLYGVCISSFLRDLRKLITGDGNCGLRFTRLAFHMSVLAALLAVQLYLVFQVKMELSPPVVQNMREVYGKFEQIMYDNSTSIGPDIFNSSRFQGLPQEVKDEICSIPLVHPGFLFCILSIWTFTVVVDLRRTVFLTLMLTWRMASVPTFHGIFLHGTEEQHGRPLRDDGKVVLVGLPIVIKALLLFCTFLPRLFVDLVLLWLGCRWLLASPDLQEAFLNAVALEFVLWLKDMIYLAVVPMRNKVEALEIHIPVNHKERAGYLAYLGSFLWIAGALLWVWLYIYKFQSVLPDYRWDVRDVCRHYRGY